MPETYEIEIPCSNCHFQRPMFFGVSGIDSEGVKFAYRCPDCGMETSDIYADVDDVLPKKITWSRRPDGEIEWFSQDAPNIVCTPTNGGLTQAQSESTPAAICG